MSDKSKLLIAIDIRLGLKYISGASEDHTLQIFEEVNNYSKYQGARTFSKNELKDLIKRAGFSKSKFYYPFPDYKLPTSVFSEEGLMSQLNISTSDFTNSTIHGNEKRIETINEPNFYGKS